MNSIKKYYKFILIQLILIIIFTFSLIKFATIHILCDVHQIKSVVKNSKYLVDHSEGQIVDNYNYNYDEADGGKTEISRKEYRPRILCWILTYPDHHKTFAKAVINTWGPRCDKLVLYSSENDAEFGIEKLEGVIEGRNGLWGKTKAAFKKIFEENFEGYDWLVKADDDAFVVLENLKFFLKSKYPDDPIYFGCNYKVIVKQGYMAGGTYVLSKEALRRFVSVGMANSSLCRPDGEGAEDAELGHCMEKVGVTAGDSRDSLGRYRFLPMPLESHIVPAKPEDWVSLQKALISNLSSEKRDLGLNFIVELRSRERFSKI